MKIAGLVGMAALAAGLQAGDSMSPDVTVYLGHAGNMLNLQARGLAHRMLAAAGVQVVWRRGEPTLRPPGELVIDLAFADAPGLECERGVLARAYPYGGGIHGITVYYDCVLATARAARVQEFKLTAHVLAHEIGHVLERLDRHSDAGLMKAHWARADFQTMGWRPVPFAEEDLALIHRALEELRGQR